MDVGIYYQILDSGIQYEKGKKDGKFWKIKERKRLREVVNFWIKIIDYIIKEEKGIICNEEFFDNMTILCKKYKFPNYENVLNLKKEILESSYSSKRSKEEEENICKFMVQIFNDILLYLDDWKSKAIVYQLLAVLHNMPKAMHGKNILCNNPKIISYSDALKYAESYMDKYMKEKYKNFLEIH